MELRDIVIRNRMGEDVVVRMRVITEFKSVIIGDEKDERLSEWRLEEEGTDIEIQIEERWRDEE